MSHIRLYLFDRNGAILPPRHRKVSTALMPGAQIRGARVTARVALGQKDKHEVVTRILCHEQKRDGGAVGAVGIVYCPTGAERDDKGYETSYAVLRPGNQISAVHAAKFGTLKEALTHLRRRVKQTIRAGVPSSVRSIRSAAEKP